MIIKIANKNTTLAVSCGIKGNCACGATNTPKSFFLLVQDKHKCIEECCNKTEFDFCVFVDYEKHTKSQKTCAEYFSDQFTPEFPEEWLDWSSNRQ